MTQKSWPWEGVAPGDGVDSGPYEVQDWWPVWGMLARAAAVLVESAGSPLRTLAAFTNVGVFYSVDNKLEVTDAGGLVVDVDTGAALVEGEAYQNDASVSLTLPASKTDWYVVLRKNYTGSTFTPTGYVAGSGTVPANTTRITWVSALTQDTDRSGYWDIPLAKFSTDGSDITSLSDEREWADAETKSLYIPALAGYNLTDGTEIALSGNVSPSGFAPRVNLPTAKLAGAFGKVVIPNDFLQDIVFEAIVAFSTSGDVYVANSANAGGCTENYNTHSVSGSLAAETISGATALNVKHFCLSSLSFSGLSVGDILRLTFTRDGTDPLDTHGSSAGVCGWNVEYLGWK